MKGSFIRYTKDVFGQDFHCCNTAGVVLVNFWMWPLAKTPSPSMPSEKLWYHFLVILELLHCRPMWTGQEGYRSRSRVIVSKPSCGGKDCPDNLSETRQCFGSKVVDCELSYWSEWSRCTASCGTSGTQSSSRHRITQYRTMWRYMLIFPHKNTILPTDRLFQWRNS